MHSWGTRAYGHLCPPDSPLPEEMLTDLSITSKLDFTRINTGTERYYLHKIFYSLITDFQLTNIQNGHV